MNFIEFIQRQPTPSPWSEGEKIPWNEPGFSQRMLQEHLSQEHDAASRRFEIIDTHVAWIHETLLGGQPAKILDLGCGPGLYSSRLARLGHSCVGIDFSPASIAYAVETAIKEKLNCSYTEADLREADFGDGYGLAMLIYGELNTFRRAEARAILKKAHQALVEGGSLLLEPHTFDAVRNIGEKPPSWYSAESGLFSDRPHIYLMENFWNPEQQATTIRYFILDGLTGEISRFAASMQAYTDEEYRSLLAECGFGDVRFHDWSGGEDGWAHKDLFLITCKKSGG
jgi:SAM-dependent methyltransferase